MLNEKLINTNKKKNVRFRKVEYPGLPTNQYFISEYGELYNSITDEIILGSITSQGYRQFKIKGFTVKAHRLVAYAFVEKNRDISLTVDHVDCNKLNNYYKNLEWVTAEENLKRAFNNGLINSSAYNTYPDELIHKICEMYEQYNYSAIEVYRIIRGTNSTPRGNKANEAFYRLLVSLRKKETHRDITDQYNYDPNEKFNAVRTPKNLVLTNDQIIIAAKLYVEGHNIADILRILGVTTGDPIFNKWYGVVFRIVHRKSFTHLTDEIFNNAEIVDHKRSTTNDRFTEEQIHTVCKYIAEGVNPHMILSKMGYFKNHPDYKKYYDSIIRIANGRYHTDISKDYFTPHKIANRKEYNLNNELILGMLTHGYQMKDICEVYGMGSKNENPNLYRAIMSQVTKFRRLNATSEITFDELQDMMINEWAANW